MPNGVVYSNDLVNLLNVEGIVALVEVVSGVRTQKSERDLIRNGSRLAFHILFKEKCLPFG